MSSSPALRHLEKDTEGIVALHINTLFCTKMLWYHKTDLPVIRPLPDLYNKSNLCTICCVLHRDLVKEEQSLPGINEGSINKAEVKYDISCLFKRLIIFGICQTVTLCVVTKNISMFSDLQVNVNVFAAFWKAVSSTVWCLCRKPS